jgi:hypothetical protein
MAMNTHLHAQLVKERLDEARAQAAQRALLRALAPPRRPVRVAIGLALIRAGQWVAGQAAKPSAGPRRATA